MNVPNLFIDSLMNPQITITDIAFETLKGQISNILVANNIYFEINKENRWMCEINKIPFEIYVNYIKENFLGIEFNCLKYMIAEIMHYYDILNHFKNVFSDNCDYNINTPIKLGTNFQPLSFEATSLFEATPAINLPTLKSSEFFPEPLDI